MSSVEHQQDADFLKFLSGVSTKHDDDDRIKMMMELQRPQLKAKVFHLNSSIQENLDLSCLSAFGLILEKNPNSVQITNNSCIDLSCSHSSNVYSIDV